MTALQPLQLSGLLKAVGAVPAGDKLRIGDLARQLGLTQAEAIGGLEWLIAAGRLDPATLRPVPLVPAAARPADCGEAEPHAKAPASPPPSGAALVDRLLAFCEQHGVTKTSVSRHLFSASDGFEELRARSPRSATVARIEAFLAAPPLARLRPRRVAKPPRASGRVGYCQAPEACVAPRKGRCSRCQPWQPTAAHQARAFAASRRRETAEASRILDADPDAVGGRNAAMTTAIATVRRQREAEARLVDPVEQAKLALRRRGRVVFDASVDGGRQGRFFVSGQNDPDTGKRLQLTATELIALAGRVNPLAMQSPQERVNP